MLTILLTIIIFPILVQLAILAFTGLLGLWLTLTGGIK